MADNTGGIEKLLGIVADAEDRFNDMTLDEDAYTPEERDEMTLDAEASAALADAAMRADFATLDPGQQDRLLDMLALESKLGRQWWENFLT